MSIAFKQDEDHYGTGKEKLNEMHGKTPLPKLKKGDEAFAKSQNITKEKLQKFMPKGTSTKVTDDIIALIHSIENDTGLAQEVAEERLMGSMHLLGKQGVTLEKLINAVKYCSLKKHMTNKQAWAITFPDEYDRLIQRGAEVDSHVSMYNSTYLVVEIDKMMIVPFYIMYDKYKHDALERQVNLMRGIGANDYDRVSPHIQHLASKTVYEMLKSPEDNTVELKIGASDAMIAQQQELSDNIARLVEQQALGFRNGGKAIDVQKVHIKKVEDEDLIDADYE